MSSFITLASVTETTAIVTVDGNAPDAKKRDFGSEGSALQLSEAREEASGFDWSDSKIREVVLKNVIIYDQMDVVCLQWLVSKKIKVNGFNALVAPDALCLLPSCFANEDLEAVKGSTLRLANIQGYYSGWGVHEEARLACWKAGFELV